VKPSIVRGGSTAQVLLLLGVCGLIACGEAVIAADEPSRALPPEFAHLSIAQQQFLARPVSAEAAAGRPATLQDLQSVRGWFAPGELEALLAVANRDAAARGEDTLPHCIPLCVRPGASGR
jgi:hypothetical protein